MMFSLVVLYRALLAVSLFNTVLLVWLSLTVLLNAEHRGWRVWLAGGGLAAGGAVFFSHSAVLIEGASFLSGDLNVWWPLGWSALIFAPLAWYVAILWHVGYWDHRESELRRRHRLPFGASLALVAALFTLFLVAKPLPFTIQGYGLSLSAAPAFLGVPLLVWLYPLFILSSIVFSLDALQHPAPAARTMGRLARRRARPWLTAASLALFSVSLVVVGVLLWLVFYGGRNMLRIVVGRPAVYFIWLDLVVGLLVAAAVVLVGEAIVSYEIFTGKPLPRWGLRRQWHHALLLAAGTGAAVNFSAGLQLPPMYIFLLASLLVVSTHALYSWRSYVERERYIRHLRPFVASEHVYDALLASGRAPSSADETSGPFAAFCREVLGAERAYLVPTATLSSLVTSPLAYPADAARRIEVDDELLKGCRSPELMILPLDPARYAGAAWAVPLWSARGLMGILLLGEKSDGGLYSQEEVELARSSGERLLDTIAAANLAQRLMALQRQRFVETQVLDQQSRRALHDEILPSLHTAMLGLSRPPGAPEESSAALVQLGEVHRRLSDLLHAMPSGRASPVGKLGLLGALREMVAAEFANDFDDVTWAVEPEAEERARALSAPTGDVIFYAATEVVRNAARHGRASDPERRLRLRLEAAWRGGLEIRIADNGVGAAVGPGATRGQGLDLHSTMLAVIGGSLVLDSKPGSGVTATLFLPEERWQGEESPPA